MRVAVAYENGSVCQHFGRTEKFKIYDILNGEILSSEITGTDGAEHCALAVFLKNANVEILICGGIGGGAVNSLNQLGIQILPGVTGNADESVRKFLEGNLDFNPDAECCHHEHDGDCGHHKDS